MSTRGPSTLCKGENLKRGRRLDDAVTGKRIGRYEEVKYRRKNGETQGQARKNSESNSKCRTKSKSKSKSLIVIVLVVVIYSNHSEALLPIDSVKQSQAMTPSTNTNSRPSQPMSRSKLNDPEPNHDIYVHRLHNEKPYVQGE